MFIGQTQLEPCEAVSVSNRINRRRDVVIPHDKEVRIQSTSERFPSVDEILDRVISHTDTAQSSGKSRL